MRHWSDRPGARKVLVAAGPGQPRGERRPWPGAAEAGQAVAGPQDRKLRDVGGRAASVIGSRLTSPRFTEAGRRCPLDARCITKGTASCW